MARYFYGDNLELKGKEDRDKIYLREPWERYYSKIYKVKNKEEAKKKIKAERIVIIKTSYGMFAMSYSNFVKQKSRLRHVLHGYAIVKIKENKFKIEKVKVIEPSIKPIIEPIEFKPVEFKPEIDFLTAVKTKQQEKFYKRRITYKPVQVKTKLVEKYRQRDFKDLLEKKLNEVWANVNDLDKYIKQEEEKLMKILKEKYFDPFVGLF